MSAREEVEALGPPPKASMFIRAWNNRRAFVRSMTGDEKAKLDKETLRRKKRKQDIRARERYIIAAMDDEAGSPMFRPDDEEWLAGQAEAALNQMFVVVCRHNGLLEPDEEIDENP